MSSHDSPMISTAWKALRAEQHFSMATEAFWADAEAAKARLASKKADTCVMIDGYSTIDVYRCIIDVYSCTIDVYIYICIIDV